MIAQQTGLISLLLVEDDEDDYLITRDLLHRQDRARFSLEWCSDYDTALATIGTQRHDVYLVDYRLGEHNGLELVREAFALRPSAPVILLTSQNDYQIDLEATALGVTDFLLKQELSPTALERSIRYALSRQAALGELARSEERYELAARAVNDGIWDWDLQDGRVHFSSRWHAALGRSDAGDVDEPDAWFELVHEDDLPRLRAAITAHINGETSHLQSEDRMRHTDGSWRWMQTRGLAIRDVNGKATRMAGSLSDVTDRRRAEVQLLHDACYDSLTGLANRALFTDRLEHALRRASRDPAVRHAVLFLDIDRFKLVNDSFSHAVGDSLLVAAAARVADAVRPGDTVARIGGDEFTILVEDVGLAEPAANAVLVAERVGEALGAEFDIGGRQMFVTASIGISLSWPGASSAELLRNADIAMYEAKRRGRGHCAVFDASMHRRVAHRLERENELRRAVNEALMQVHYQPVVNLETGLIRGFEALVRWPKGWAPVSPVEFIPVAEEVGLIRPLGLQVLGTALANLREWRRGGLIAENVRMSVNVSCRQLDDPRFSEDVLGALAAVGLPGDALCLEITEGTLMREPERMSKVVADVCATGVHLELDDFGTGYSSLTALQQFPVEALKIDRSFVAAMEDGNGSEAIVRSTVALAHSLGLGVVAEGIEEVGQLQRLRALGCEYGQGYLFAKPLDAAQVEELVKSYRAR